MAGEDLRPSERLHGDTRFDQIRRSGVRAGDGLLFVRALANDLGHPRLGLAVGKVAGRAVVRTRLRRMFREAFRLNKGKLPAGLDLLVSPRRGAAGASLEKLEESLLRLAKKIADKLDAEGK